MNLKHLLILFNIIYQKIMINFKTNYFFDFFIIIILPKYI